MKRKLAIGVSAIAISAVATDVAVNLATVWQGGIAIAAPAAPARMVAAAGLVEPASEARQLEATMVGRLVTMSVAEGDNVTTGDAIAEIENADLKAQLAEAEATLAVRENELKRLLTGARPQEIDQAKAALREAEAAAAEARSNYERQNSLAAKQIVSAAVVEQALANRDTSEARRALVAAQLSLLRAPPRVEDASIARANIDAARAKIVEIKAQIEKTIIRAPIDGRILKLLRRKGESVSNLPPTPIATIGDTSRLRVRADVDQADVANVALGQTAWITADGFVGRRFRGTVTRIGVQLGPKNFRTNDPAERVDTKVLEVLIDLDSGVQLPIGLPVDVVFDRAVNPASQTGSDIHGPPIRPEQNAGVSSVMALPAPVKVPMTPEREPPSNPDPVESSDALSDQPAGSAMVQIGSYITAELAKSGWAEFTAKHSEFVAGFSPDIRIADLGSRGKWYRLRFGPLSHAAAVARCLSLKSQGGSCLVVAP